MRRVALVLSASAFIVLAASLPAEAFSQAFFHTQSLNNRGVDVEAVQYLLRQHGYGVSVDGVFGSGTQSAVKSFQSAKGLTADGVVGASTWAKLVVTVKRGSSGEAVKAVQRELNAKRGAGLAVDGVFGAGTESAVKSFQSHAGVTADGIVGPTTWKNLIWHYQKPDFAALGLCKYNGGNGDLGKWGTAALVGQVHRAAAVFASGGSDGKWPIGDVSLEHGGDMSGHASHEVGLDVDTRLIRTDSAQCSYGCSYTQSCYDRAGTKRLIDAIVDAAPGHVKIIFFNDPQLAGYRGVVDPEPNHDNHLHVRYCEKVHSDSRYDC